MNEFVGSVLVPMRNSLILTGLVSRTRSVVVSRRQTWFFGLIHLTRPARSPSNGVRPAVTVNVALTRPPGATAGKVFERAPVPATTARHRAGVDRLSRTPTAREPVVLVNVSVTFWLVPSAKVWT